MMFDAISCAMTHGFPGSKPWSQQGHLKFLCPSPGYDRHFAITEYFGFELVTVPMTSEGPDMDVVEELVQNDPHNQRNMVCAKVLQPDRYHILR